MSEEPTSEDLVLSKKVDDVKWFRTKAIEYRQQALNIREMVRSKLKDARGLKERAKRFEGAADSIELEISGNW